MSQSDYQYACERAELMGQPIPSEEEWKEAQRAEAQNHVTEGDDNEVMQNLTVEDESADRVHGGLDELNTILNTTQKQIARFKTVWGVISSSLKVRKGSRNSTPLHKAEAAEAATPKDAGERETPAQEEEEGEESLTVEAASEESAGETPRPARTAEGNPATPKRIDLNQKMGSHLDKLDSLINKAETAHYSMQHQNKQMRRILK